MKSIKQQYIDLTEGRMSQANFMRNLRMMMPQYITNVTSFNDSVKILKNKGILSEMRHHGKWAMDDITPEELAAMDQVINKSNNTKDHKEKEDEDAIMAMIKKHEEEESGRYTTGDEQFEISEAKTKWENTSGKSMYDQFKEIDNLNSHEVLIGIDYEIEKNHELTKDKAIKLVLKNLKKDPYYYTTVLMAGKEGYKAEYISPSTKPETQNMTPVKGENFVDKANEMKPVKGIEKPKKDSDTATSQKYKTSGISLMSLVAKTARGVKKMDATGEKMKTIKEEYDPEIEGEESPAYKEFVGRKEREKELSKSYNGLMKGSKVIVDPEVAEPAGLKKNKIYTIKSFSIFGQSVDANFEEGGSINIKYLMKAPSVLQRNLGSVKESAEDRLAEQISQYIKETFDGRDNLTDVTGENQ